MRGTKGLTAGAIVALCACGGSGHVDVAVATQAVAADAVPADQLIVTVDEVALHVGGDDDEADLGGNSTSGWHTVFAGALDIDLYDVNATATFLGGVDVPPGKITQLRLILDANPTLVVDGETHEVACPSCTQTGIKLVPSGKLDIAAGDRLALELVFDPATSLATHDGGYRLSPVLKLETR